MRHHSSPSIPLSHGKKRKWGGSSRRRPEGERGGFGNFPIPLYKNLQTEKREKKRNLGDAVHGVELSSLAEKGKRDVNLSKTTTTILSKDIDLTSFGRKLDSSTPFKEEKGGETRPKPYRGHRLQSLCSKGLGPVAKKKKKN